MSQHGPSSPFPLPCPSVPVRRELWWVLTLCFSLQTMLTAISMSAIATNGVVPGRAEPVSVCVPGARGAGSLPGWVPAGAPVPQKSWAEGGKGLFPESIPRGHPTPWTVLAELWGCPGLRTGGWTSPPAAPRPSATSPRGFPMAGGGAWSWSRHPSPEPQGADGSESRQPRLLPPPDW